MLSTIFLWLKARHPADHPAEYGIEFSVVVAIRTHSNAKSKAVSPLHRFFDR